MTYDDNAIDKIKNDIKTAVMAEREACARTCEKLNDKAAEFQRPNGASCAMAIRMGSNVKLTGRGPES